MSEEESLSLTLSPSRSGVGEGVGVIDTHAHLDGEEFKDDTAEVIQRAKDAGVGKIFIPAINADSIVSVPRLCKQYPGYLYPMMGLQPEEVNDDYVNILDSMYAELKSDTPYIAVGEVGLDFYWSRDFEKQQLDAFERQMQWSMELQLPLMIHCRKAQNELLHIMKPYMKELPGGVFHCFTGNPKEAERYLEYSNFCLGIGGVLTFKSSHLREDLPEAVPLSRIVLETDSPYMAPVPHRGQRNESSFVVEVAKKLSEVYGVSYDEVARTTTANAMRIFNLNGL